MSVNSKIAILILAAGSSSRMGRPKQLLKWKNSNLLGHTISIATQLKVDEIILVLGANSDKIISEIDQKIVRVLINHNWKLGLGSSISSGVNLITENYSDLDGVLIILSDQPLIEYEHYLKLINGFTSGKDQIIATKYNDGKLGVPALFDKVYFKDLCSLHSDIGAKQLLTKYQNNVTSVTSGQSAFDIDTREQYEALYKANH